MKKILSFILLLTLASTVSFAQHSDLKAYGLKGKVKRISTSDREGVAFDKITYTKFDSHGNWTECRWDGTLKITDDGGDTYHNEKYSHKIKREIIYY